MKQTLTELKGEIDSNKILVGDFNIPLSMMARTTRQKINKEIEDLNSTIAQSKPTVIYRPLHPTAEYTFFPSAYGTFSMTAHMLEHISSQIQEN